MIKKIGFAAVFAMAVSCGTETESSNNGDTQVGGKGDFTDKVVCNIINKSGREVDPSQLRDPIMGFGLRGGECPTDLKKLIEKFQATEGDINCQGSVETYVISESAQPAGTANGSSYRLVLSKECGDLKRHKMMFSIFGVSPKVADPTDSPDDWRIPMEGAEMLAYDDTNGVYNYYQHTGGDNYEFFGDSNDFVNHEGGRCKECHTAGTPVMVELDTPWLHWEGHEDVPGAANLVKSNKDVLGSKRSGSTLESIIKKGNREYTPRRIETARLEGNLKKLLKPLFCPTEVNVDNFGDFKSTKVSSIRSDFWLDIHLNGVSVSTTSEIYEQGIIDSGQFVEGVAGENNKDTIFRGAFLERSFSDNHYVDQLSDLEIVDDNFVLSVLLVDFTQPIFSDIRCALLDLAPTGIDLAAGLTANDNGANNGVNNGTNLNNGVTTSTNGTGGSNNGTTGTVGPESLADQIRNGFIENLRAAEGNEAAMDLLANLEAESANEAPVKTFMDACKARDQKEMMDDVLRILSFHRNMARSMEVFEFINKLPQDTLNERSPIALDQTTCDFK